MKLSDYQTLFGDALGRGETIICACTCTIRYSGRAESKLERGDRIVIIKSDGALLVHQPFGTAPINYMKNGTSHTVRFEDKTLILNSSNLTLKEKMTVTIHSLHFFNSHKLEDTQTITIAGTEEDMSDMIYSNPEILEKGFKPVAQEEQTKYGFIDVMGVDKDGTLTVVECKRYKAELSAVTQLRRYVEKIMVSKGISKVRGILAAPSITDNAKKMLEDWGFEFKNVNPPKYLEDYSKKQKKLDGF